MKTQLTAQQATATIDILKTFLECIKMSGSQGIPSGHLYAQVMAYCPLDKYEALITIIIKTGLVKKQGHLLIAV
jgi:hypothetical protein